MPPSDTRTNLRPERARDRLAQRGLADAGRADEREDRARAAPGRLAEPALAAAACARPGTRGCGPSRPRGRRGRRPARGVPRRCRALSSAAHAPRQLGHPVEVRADPAVLRATARRCARGGRARARPPSRTSSGMPASLDLARGTPRRRRPSPSSPSSLRIALICSRSRNSRWRFSMPSLTSVRILSFSSISASVSLRPRRHELEARLDVEGLEDLDLLLEATGRASSRWCRRSRRGRLMPRRNSATCGTPRDSTIDLDDGPVLARELLGPRGGRLGVVGRLDLDPEWRRRCRARPRPRRRGGGLGSRGPPARRAGGRRPRPSRRCRPGRSGRRAAGRAAARRRRAASTAARGLVGLDREGDDHAGQHDAGGQGQEGEGLRVDRHDGAPSDACNGPGHLPGPHDSLERPAASCLFPSGNRDYTRIRVCPGPSPRRYGECHADRPDHGAHLQRLRSGQRLGRGLLLAVLRPLPPGGPRASRSAAHRRAHVDELAAAGGGARCEEAALLPGP